MNHFISFLVFAICLFDFQKCRAEMFTSIEQVRGVVRAQRKIADELKGYVAEERSRLAKVKSMIERFERESSIPENELTQYISNPINAYRTVRRYQGEGFSLERLVTDDKAFKEAFGNIEPLLKALPSQEDYEGSIAGLLRLQSTYDLQTELLVDGHLHPQASNASKLSAEDCFEIGRVAYTRSEWDVAVEWLTKALEIMVKEPPSVRKVNRATLLDYLAFANYQIGHYEAALYQTEELLLLQPDHQNGKRNILHYKRLLGEGGKAKGETKDDPYFDYVDANEFKQDKFKALCQGRKIKPIKNEHLLYCDYARNNDPRLVLAPLKRETVHLDPWIMMYHDVISDSEIQFFKKAALPKLNRATTRDPVTGELGFADYRITKTAWLNNDTDSVIVPRLLRRASMISQLTLEHVEPFQVANYGIGGHYSPHFDFCDDNKVEEQFGLEEGNRFATLLFYLSDVKAGGATIFTDLGLTIWPQKGSAAFWYNLHKSGLGDNSLKHAACPVLYGNKWVMNKWFHYGGNEFWYPSIPNKDARLTPYDIETAPPTYHRVHGRLAF